MFSNPYRFLFLITICSAALSASANVENVDVETFQKLTSSGDGIILDVRTPDEVAAGHLPNASVIDFYSDDFLKRIKLMQKDKAIYVYCRSGGRSAKAAKIMEDNGFKQVYNLLGGIGAWKKANLPIEMPDTDPIERAPGISNKEFNKELKSNTRLLAAFKTEWCAPCKQMNPILDSLETELSGKAKIIRIDIDSSPKLAEAHKIAGVPVFILFKDGRESWRHSGAISKDELKAKTIASKYN